MLERIILLKSSNLFKTQRNQFGFKAKTSCNHAIFAVKETILNYTEKNTKCRVAALDAEKAFDKVWRNGLFFKLKNKMDYNLWFILKAYYDSSKAIIKNHGLSDIFLINCGVKQGGILSAYLFNLFIDDLIASCVNMNIGGLIHNINTSIIVYADDILLISPNDSHLQILLDTCCKYGNEWLIKFNSKKSNIVNFGNNINRYDFMLNGSTLNQVHEIKYLGYIINSKMDSNDFALSKFKKVQSSIFSLSFLGLKPHAINPCLQAFIYKTYCLSKFTYSLENMTLNATTRNFLNLLQNKCLRQIIGLRKYSHISNVLKCLKIYNFDQLYTFSKLIFLNTISNNEICSEILNYLIENKECSNRSNSFRRDIFFLEKFFNNNINFIYTNCKYFKLKLKKIFCIKNNGLCCTIFLCLYNYKFQFFRNFLDKLININFEIT